MIYADLKPYFYLNTSYVKVQQLDGRGTYIEHTFKYILC